MHVKLFLIAVFLTGFCLGDDLMDLINSVFKTETEPTTEGHHRFAIATPRTPAAPSREGQPLKSCGFGKRCVQEYLCSKSQTNSDGATLINVRFNIDEPKECPFLEKCCPVDDIVTTPIVRPVETTSGCGYRNIDGVGFKIDGETLDAEFGEFPWMLAIMYLRQDADMYRNVYRCGGSLIHPQVALTGAHCVYDKPASSFKVRAGEWETNSQNEVYPHQEHDVAHMVIHEDFNSANLRNDIALLFLAQPFDLAPNVNTLCLPPVGYNFDFSRCYASGWGKNKFQGGEYQNILKKVNLPIVPSYLCQDYLRQTRLGKNFELHWSFLCAGGERGKDTCEGDGGSPLVCPIENTVNRYYQAGIVAWGIGCGDEYVPGVYGKVSAFKPWIDFHMASKGYDSSFYTA